MASTAKPKAEVGEKFRQQVQQLASWAAKQASATQNSEAGEWYRPDGFEETLTDIKAFHPPFDRVEQENQFVASAANKEEPGTVGDLQLVQLQGDFMACAERAFRARHHSTCRSRIQPLSRQLCHAAKGGSILRGLLNYIVNMDRINRGE